MRVAAIDRCLGNHGADHGRGMSAYSGLGDKDRFITVHLKWVLVGSDLVMEACAWH